MPDQPAHHGQPTEPDTTATDTTATDTTATDTTDTDTTDSAATVNGAPTTAAAPDALADPAAESPSDTAADTAAGDNSGDGAPGTAGGAEVPATDTERLTADVDTAAASSPEREGKPTAPGPRSRRRRTGTRSVGTPRRRAAAPETPPAAPAEPARVTATATAHDRVWAALRSHPGSTPAELSTAAGVARSTITKLLTAWAADGSVTSTPAATGRAGRAPHRWTAAPSDLPPAPAAEAAAATSADTHLDRGTGRGSGTRRRRGAATPSTTSTAARARGAAPDRDRSRGSAGSGAVPVNGAGRNQSGNPRLASGALQGMVQDFLTEHPGEHGPTGIGRALGRSSGAVANALERLVDAGWAVRTNDRPRRYRTADQSDHATTRGYSGTEELRVDGPTRD